MLKRNQWKWNLVPKEEVAYKCFGQKGWEMRDWSKPLHKNSCHRLPLFNKMVMPNKRNPLPIRMVIEIENSFQNKVYTSEFTPVPNPSFNSPRSLIILKSTLQFIKLGSLKCSIKSVFMHDRWTVYKVCLVLNPEKRKYPAPQSLDHGRYAVRSLVPEKWSNWQIILQFLVLFQPFQDLKGGLRALTSFILIKSERNWVFRVTGTSPIRSSWGFILPVLFTSNTFFTFQIRTATHWTYNTLALIWCPMWS